VYVIPSFTFHHGNTNSNIKASQRHPIDWMIYHFVAFGQLLLFAGCNIWIFFIGSFALAEPDNRNPNPIAKILDPLAVVIALLYVWITAATGRFGKIRWWPSRDHLSCLIPLSIKNATVTKCR
jgi:hypothetical protein